MASPKVIAPVKRTIVANIDDNPVFFLLLMNELVETHILTLSLLRTI